MHQHPRPAPRSASAASNPSTNPERTNNQREGPPHRTRSSVDLASYTERAGGQTGNDPRSRSDSSAAGPSQDREMTKLNQIIQHFFTKAALTICGARANLPQVHTRSGEVKQDRWFNIVLDDTDVLLDALQEWKRSDLSDDPPLPLVIESYIDTANLSPNQALVAVDETGKRWDVSEALSAGSAGSSPRPSHKNGGRLREVVLERWTIELGDKRDSSPAELNDALPNVYKKGVVLFRSLYTFLRFLPAWKLYRRLGRHQGGGNGGLRLKFRIRQGRQSGFAAQESEDALFKPLFPSEQVREQSNFAASSDEDIYHAGSETHTISPPPTATAHLGALHTPGGPLHIRVDYRRSCDFQAADAEALISSRFLHHDEGIPTLQGIGSLPTARSSYRREQAQTQLRQPRALLGAYGSLGTFHATGKRESPLSALQHRRTDSQEEDQYNMDRRLELTGAGKPPAQRSSTTSDGKSVFKAGSLGSSPRSNQPPPATSPIGISPPRYDRDGNLRDPSKIVSAGTFIDQVKMQKDEIRAIGTPDKSKRQSLSTLPQKALRVPPASLPNETAIASSGSSSPMGPPAMPRYTSSFANRPKRASSTASQPGQAADSGGSSARASGSDNAGSGNVSDEGDVAAFIGLVESAGVKKMISSKPVPGHSVNFSKYNNTRDGSGQLADEMSASSLINASSTPPSRRLSNVPGLSTSSSPSRQMAHVPAVRSRLSTQSITEETGRPSEEGEEEEEEEEPFIFHTEGI